MKNDLINKIPKKFNKYNFEKIESGASKRLFFRLSYNCDSVILMDSRKEKNNYYDYIKVHSYLSKINISIPKIFENIDKHHIIILEDFGSLRYDKILSKYSLKELLSIAVKNLILIKNEINFDSSYSLDVYNFNSFKKEISELPKYYYPYIYKKNMSKSFEEEYYECWKNCYDSLKYDFTNFIHKDFNINNLMYLPSRKRHLSCGILDFQSAFWGDSTWDLFSLLEDSRILFEDKYNDYLINFYYKKTNQNISFNDFKQKYYILNCSRQSRLLGRWVKLSQKNNQAFYLNFLKTTKKRLLKGIIKADNKKLYSLYKKLIPELNEI